MLSDKKYGLTVTILATRVLPVLTPQMVNPQLDSETYVAVRSTIQDMFDYIDRCAFLIQLIFTFPSLF